MKKMIVFVLMLGLFPTAVLAHLCNDVFEQAHDNLAVKVDIRDGQLRISDHSKFKVYLFNTMDRTIDDIHLEVMTEDFETNVTPASEWSSFPRLMVRRKQYFEVELRRKSGTGSGKYKIDLRLVCDGRDLKTVNFDETLSVIVVPENSTAPIVDGVVSSAEWRDSVLCTSLLQVKLVKAEGSSSPLTMKTVPADSQTRFRFSRHQDTLYGLIDFMEQTSEDIAYIYVANDYESKPTVIIANLQEQTAFIEGDPDLSIQTAVNGTKMELALPLEILPINEQESFYLNVVRKVERRFTWWRGGVQSYKDPIVYETFKL